MKTSTRIVLVGDYNEQVIAHTAIPKALQLAQIFEKPVEAVWMPTCDLAEDFDQKLLGFTGIWCVPGSPYVSMHGALNAIRHARETNVPFLGTCGGFQHALIEYARNVLGFAGADHTETAPNTSEPVINRLACSLVNKSAPIRFQEGSNLRRIYGSASAEEGYQCNYGLNPRYEAAFAQSPLRFAARDEAGEVRGFELPGHDFFIGTLFQPERAALRGQKHPVVEAFVQAATASTARR